MHLLDVNILIYAFHEDSSHHDLCHTYLTSTIGKGVSILLPSVVVSGFLRIATHPRIINKPASFETALQFISDLLEQPTCHLIEPGARHWSIFTQLCCELAIKGNDVPDAYIAALAIERSAQLISSDQGFARFPGLQWRPLKP